MALRLPGGSTGKDIQEQAETLNVFPLPEKFEAEFLWSLKEATGASCPFAQDSGDESALA